MANKNPLSPIGVQIDAVRQRYGLSLYRVAKNAGMDYAQLYRVMRGKVQPTRDSVLRICRAIGCNLQDASEIFEATDYRTPKEEELQEDHIAA